MPKVDTKQKFYPDDHDAPKAPAPPAKPTKIRASITPGTVLILLAGHFRGKRVICLGALPSGLLLVTGPFEVNGVPLRRVNQAYVIATSTKLDVSGVRVPAEAKTDAYYKVPAAVKAERKRRERLGEEGFFKVSEMPAKEDLPAARKETQKAVDAAILGLPAVDATFKAYLRTPFSLSKGDKPHEMKF